MSVCGQTGQTEEDTASEEAGASARELHKQKPASKVVRVLTVLAYLLSVSLAAILLSVYYVCAWTSPELARNVSQADALTGSQGHGDYPDSTIRNFTGGGNTTVNDTTPEPADVVAGPTSSSVATEEVTTPTLDTAAPLTTTRETLNGTSDNIGTVEVDSIT